MLISFQCWLLTGGGCLIHPFTPDNSETGSERQELLFILVLNFWFHYVLLVCLLGSEGWITKGGGCCIQFTPGKFKLVLLAIGKWKWQKSSWKQEERDFWQRNTSKSWCIQNILHNIQSTMQKQGTDPAFLSGNIQYTLQISVSFLKWLPSASTQWWIRLQAAERWKQYSSQKAGRDHYWGNVFQCLHRICSG